MGKKIIIGFCIIVLFIMIAMIIYAAFSLLQTPTAVDNNTTHEENTDNSTIQGEYAGYIEYDPNRNITVTENRIVFSKIHRNYEGIVYKDYGIGYFGEEFIHTFQFKVTSPSDAVESTFMPWSVSNDIGTINDFMSSQNCTDNTTANFSGLTITIQPRLSPDSNHTNRTGPRGFLSDWSIKTRIQFLLPAEDFYGKMIYTTVVRTNGQLGVFFYRDYARQDIITSAVIRTGLETYRILQAFGSRGSIECEPDWNPYAYVSGYVENLKVE